MTTNKRTIINIDEISPPTDLIIEKLLKQANKNIINPTYNKLFYMKAPELNHIRSECDNGFISSIFHAYNYHLTLSLNPNNIFLIICQSISEYILNNSEKYRKIFVNHEGKKKLKLNICIEYEDNIDLIDWDSIIDEFNILIEKNTNIDISKSFKPDFSNTTKTDITACNITTMVCLKNYFKYHMMEAACGIRKVIMEGDPEDWTKLIDKVHNIQIVLGEAGVALDNWFQRLYITLHELNNTAHNIINKDFWGHIITLERLNGSGINIILSGWFINFFYAVDVELVNEMYLGRNPIGYSDVPIVWEKKDESLLNLKIFSGIWSYSFNYDEEINEYIISCNIQWGVLYDDLEPLSKYEYY